MSTDAADGSAFSLDLSPDVREMRDWVHQFASDVIRPAGAEWGQRMPWVNRSHEPEWYRFAHRATPRQLALFGFPPPGHPYWAEASIAGTAQRYPGWT